METDQSEYEDDLILTYTREVAEQELDAALAHLLELGLIETLEIEQEEGN